MPPRVHQLVPQTNGESGGVGASYSDSSTVSCHEPTLKSRNDHMKDSIQELSMGQTVDNTFASVITGERYV